MFKEFRDFINRGNVIDLAVGIIMGAAFTSIVNSFVNDIIMPPIGFITGGIDLANMYVSLSGGHFASLAEAKKAGATTINFGLFINSAINFLIVSFAVFVMVKNINRLRKIEDKKAPPQAKTEQLLEEIRDLLKKQGRK